MSETVKRYLLPSEIEGVLRDGLTVYIDAEHYRYRYTFTVERGLTGEYRDCGDTVRWNDLYRFQDDDDKRRVADDNLKSFFCYTLVNACECGRPLRLDNKCSICDDYFELGAQT